MRRFWFSFIVLSIVLVPMHVTAQTSGQAVYFPQTGHHLDDQHGFLRFWRANSQTLRFGYPISEPFVRDDIVMQYFERARFEYHPASDQLLLGLLGTESHGIDAAVQALPNSRFFVETGHNLQGEFRQYWEQSAGLALLGYPISEQLNDNGLLVQWFERGRLEYHPEAMRPLWREYERARNLNLDPLYEMQTTLVGVQQANATGIDLKPMQRRSGVADWSPSLWRQSIRVSLSSYTLTAYEDDLPVLTSTIAIGKPGFETVVGDFNIGSKWLQKDMKSSENGESWDTKAVPFTQFFYRDWAIHGTYWHTSFGTQRSHGCINLPLAPAEWLYAWTGDGSVTVIVVP